MQLRNGRSCSASHGAAWLVHNLSAQSAGKPERGGLRPGPTSSRHLLYAECPREQGTSPPALASGAFRGASLTAPARARARFLVYPTRNQRPSPGFPGFGALPRPRAGARHSGRLSQHQRRWDPRRGTESRSCRLSKHCRRKSPHSPCCRLSWSTAWSTAWSQLSVEATKEALPIVLGTSDTSAASHTPGRSKLPSAVRNAAGLARRLLPMLVHVRPPGLRPETLLRCSGRLRDLELLPNDRAQQRVEQLGVDLGRPVPARMPRVLEGLEVAKRHGEAQHVHRQHLHADAVCTGS